MTGGGAVVRAEIRETPVAAAPLADDVVHPAAGAVVTFEGVVRDHDGGRGVTALGYTAHPNARGVIAAVCADVAARHPGVRLAAVHRIGELRIGDVAIACAVASAHRGAAFAACADLVDELKRLLPVWKEQHFADGTSEWVGSA